MERVTSRTNPLMAHIRKLIASRSYRRERREMVCEGPKMLQEAIWSQSHISVVVQTEKVSKLPDLPDTVRRVFVPEDLLRWVSDTKEPQSLLFLCSIPETRAMAPQGARYLILDGIQDPGNLGTIWRTADAFGADGLFLLGGCTDPWGSKTVRATMGACFRLPVWEVSLPELRDVLNEFKLPLYATALGDEALDIQKVSLQRAAVVIGSEGKGVSPEVLDQCDKRLTIPMRARCESLNAAVAASVVLWEMAPQEIRGRP